MIQFICVIIMLQLLLTVDFPETSKQTFAAVNLSILKSDLPTHIKVSILQDFQRLAGHKSIFL